MSPSSAPGVNPQPTFTVATSLFADGGCVEKNPSPKAGTWAWCAVENGELVYQASGVVTPEEAGMPAITNNLTELLAALLALEAMPDGWDGTLHTDSQVTLFRLTGGKKFNGIPKEMVDRVAAVRARLGVVNVALLDGHPTRKQLEAGIGKRGHHVSKWNVLCDRLCNEAAWKFLGKMAEKSGGRGCEAA